MMSLEDIQSDSPDSPEQSSCPIRTSVGNEVGSTRAYMLSLALLTICGGTPVEEEPAMQSLVSQTLLEDAQKIPGIGQRMIFLARSFLGVPTKKRILTQTGPEQLVVNFEAMNCLSFVESMLALAYGENYGAFLKHLRSIRYKNGLVNYADRNHYVTMDWIPENREYVEDATSEIGGPYTKMVVKRLRKVGPDRGMQRETRPAVIIFIPKQYIDRIEDKIQDGDIIFFTSPRGDRDIQHAALAVWQNGKLHLLHARSGANVQIDPRPLKEYLKLRNSHGYDVFSGIKIVRPRVESEENPVIDNTMTFEEAIEGVAPECPTSTIEKQTLVEVLYYSFDGRIHQGQIVIDQRLANDIREVFQLALEMKFPITSAIPLSHEQFRWSDDRSMKDNNTSGFNCRPIAGQTNFSNHSLGFAIDINPMLNPYCQTGGRVSPKGSSYNPTCSGTFTADHPLVKKFMELGWKWGGQWKNPDYQHFEKVLE